MPGISDHEALYIESKLAVYTTPPIQRKVYLWSRADFCNTNLNQNSQAVKKISAAPKVKKDVKSKVAAKKWL